MTVIKLRFAQKLEELRIAAGKPSYSELERRHGTLRRSTIGDALTGRTTPSLDLTLTYVRTCRLVAEAALLPTDGPMFDVDVWREGWLELQRALLPYRRRHLTAPEPRDAPDHADREPDPVPAGRDRDADADADAEPEREPVRVDAAPPADETPFDETPWVVQQRRLRPVPSWTASASRATGTEAGPGGTAVARSAGLLSALELAATLDDALRLGLAAVWVTGAPGAGKTTLAVRWARAAHERFPDGLAFVDLGAHGATGRPVPVEAALATAIAELGGGVRPDGPTCREFLTRLFRDLTSRRRVLVILDDACPDLDVERLIPVGPGSLTIVTSRFAPTTPDDAVFVLPIGP